MARHLRSEGHDIICVSSRTTRFGRLLDIVFTLLKHRRRMDLVLIEVYSGLGFVIADVAGWVAMAIGVPSVFVLHGGNLPGHAARHPQWTRRVLNRASIIVAPSEFLATSMSKNGLRIRVIPNVLNAFPDAAPRTVNLKPRLLWMRSFHPIYDPITAVNAFVAVKKEVSEATLVMAGPDKGLEKETKDHVADLGLSDSVVFPGFLDAEGKAREFSNADIFITTNLIDNSPVSLIEAWSYGLLVVATDVGGIPFMVRDGVNGLLASSGDAEGVARKILALIEDPDLAAELSHNGRETARASTWEAVVPLWARAFEDALPPHEATQIRQPV